MWNGHILTLERRRNLKKYAPELIDDFKKYSNFQSFSYIRVCFSRIDFAQKLWDFDKIQIYISMKKSMVNLDVYNMSQQAPTIKSYKQLKWRYQMKGRCKICLPCINFFKTCKMYVHVRKQQGGLFSPHKWFQKSTSHHHSVWWWGQDDKWSTYTNSPTSFLLEHEMEIDQMTTILV